MSDIHIWSAIYQSIISRVAKNPLTYAFLFCGALVTEEFGLFCDNPYAQNFACAAAYYTTAEPRKTPACVKVIERSRHPSRLQP